MHAVPNHHVSTNVSLCLRSYLFVLWTCGIVVRYLIILPIRVLSLVVGFSFFFLVFSLVKMVPDKCIEAREEWERSLIRFACSLFVFSWTGVVR
jgi:glycerol-3-phosphate O-acyltransferase 3/4